MKIKFWGVRGSIPTPLTNKEVKNRISTVLQRIKPHNLKSAESKEIFLSQLPENIFGTIGGNTTCIEIKTEDTYCLIFDAGTGIRELGKYYIQENIKINTFHVFFTHFHWDHIQGIPFFSPSFIKKNIINFYSPAPNFKSHLEGQMQFPYFPIEMEIFPATLEFHEIKEKKIKIGKTEIIWKRMKHPGGCFAYKVIYEGKSIIIATDSEITEKEFSHVDENINFFKDSDMLILDSQYTLEESINKIDWGHSSYSIGVDLASEWHVKNLVLFHHEPLYTDTKLISIERLSKWYLNHLENQDLNIMVAIEGKEIEI